MTALNSWVGRAVFHLDCGPAAGDLPEPVKACAALRTAPALVASPEPYSCFGGPSSWWDVTIEGRLNSRAIQKSFSTCWTPQIALLRRLGMSWDVLRMHVVSRSEAVLPGTSHVFPPGRLRPGDFVTCDILGHHLRLSVPVETGTSPGAAFGGANAVTVTLTLTRHADGSVSASCHRGE
jgi:hypothetical protein